MAEKSPTDKMAAKKSSELFSLSLTVQIGIALVLAVFVFTALYWFASDSWKAEIVFFGAAVAAAGQIAAAFYAGRTLRLANNIEGQRLAVEERVEKVLQKNTVFDFAARWNDASMVDIRIAFQEILAKGAQEKNTISGYIDADPKRKANVGNLLNFLDVMALSVSTLRSDEEIAKRVFCGVVINTWGVTHDWVQHQRTARGRPQLWIELETLHKRWSV
jgi:hypothetical protein